MAKLNIGWSEVSITPDKRFLLRDSFPSGSVSTWKTITVTAKAEQGGHYSAFIASGTVGHHQR